MSILISPEVLPYPQRLMKAFRHPYAKVCLFSGSSLPSDLLKIFLTLVAEGRSLREMESDYFKLSGRKSLLPGNSQASSRHHMYCFARGLKTLLAHKSHYAKALDFIMANVNTYTEISNGVFDQQPRKNKGPILIPPFPDLPNYCRNADGVLRSREVILSLVQAPSDADVLIISAIVNRDYAAVNLLKDCLDSEISTALSICRNPACHEEKSDEVTAHTDFTYAAELKQMLDCGDSTYKDFEKAFWPGASQFAVDAIVSQALKPVCEAVPALENLLQLFKDKGVDLYPGMILRHNGPAAYLDVLVNPPHRSTRSRDIMDFAIARIDGQKIDKPLCILLNEVPLGAIMDFKSGQYLLKYLYMGMRDRRVLRVIEDKTFHADMLENSLGL